MYGAAAGSNGIVWGGLRNMGLAAHIAVAVSQFPGAAPFLTTRYGCFAASQLNYILGDTGRSFLVGAGTNPPTQAHTREGFCTRANTAAECTYWRWLNGSYANPNVRLATSSLCCHVMRLLLMHCCLCALLPTGLWPGSSCTSCASRMRIENDTHKGAMDEWKLDPACRHGALAVVSALSSIVRLLCLNMLGAMFSAGVA